MLGALHFRWVQRRQQGVVQMLSVRRVLCSDCWSSCGRLPEMRNDTTVPAGEAQVRPMCGLL